MSLPKVLLIGPPNSGKSSLFRHLTGVQVKSVNYPGSTMNIQSGVWNGQFELLDTPGAYSLSAQTQDEQLTFDLLNKTEDYQGIWLVLDATQLKRQWGLFQEIQNFKKPLLIILTMKDLLTSLDVQLDTQALTLQYGISWVCVQTNQANSDINFLQETQKFVSLLKTNPLALQVDLSYPLQLAKLDQSLSLGLESWSLKWDRIALHRLWGLPLFAVTLFLIFASLFWVSDPLMSAVEAVFEALQSQTAGLNLWGFEAFLSEAIIPAVGAFAVFIPQIAMLFILLGLLEASGYMARGVTLLDHSLKKFGLSGRSFAPLIAGYACAIPAILSTRQLSSLRERQLVLWVTPLLSCSARLPVFIFLVQGLWGQQSVFLRVIALFLIYLISTLIAFAAAGFINRILPKPKQESILAIDLPWYRRPALGKVFYDALLRSWDFVTRAGPVIMVLSLLMWGLSRYPQGDDGKITESYLGQLSVFMEPLFSPIGVDGKTGIAILSAFAAREVFVSTYALVHSLDPGLLPEAITQTVAITAQPRLSNAALAGLIIFFIIALQCLSTVALQAKESGSWFFALSQLFIFNGIAYLLAWVTFNVVSFF